MNWSKLGIAAVLGFLVAGFSSAASGDEAGARIFKAKCAVCHGANGKGDAVFNHRLQHLGAADLTKIESLKPAEIDGLVAYIKSLK